MWRKNGLTFCEKQLVSLRISYMGGYTGYFRDGVRRLLRMGFSLDEMKAAAVDDTMRMWIDDATKERGTLVTHAEPLAH